MPIDDTIFALSSGGLPSGVAVVRMSGPETLPALSVLIDPVPEKRIASLRTIRKRNGDLLDQGLVIVFPGPASFTGDDCAELQIHGGRAVVQAVLDELEGLGLRHAQAGEFSRRAFQHGKLDLVEIEGLADLMASETEMQRRLAVEQSSGHLSALYATWAKRLTHARAMIEAELDFADEDDVPGSVASKIWTDMRALIDEISDHIDKKGVGEIIREGMKIVIAGLPNAGKSSLLNALAKRDVAIVTEIAGTTRDILSVDISLAGFSIRLTDTAGLRDTDDVVEREGVRRARRSVAEADLVLLLADHPDGFIDLDIDPSILVLRVGTKMDRSDNAWTGIAVDALISTTTGDGLTELLNLITAQLPDLSGPQAFALPTRVRHVAGLSEARDAIRSALAAEMKGLDIQAEYLRVASDALGRITGRVDVEHLLDVIFSEFCIGK